MEKARPMKRQEEKSSPRKSSGGGSPPNEAEGGAAEPSVEDHTKKSRSSPSSSPVPARPRGTVSQQRRARLSEMPPPAVAGGLAAVAIAADNAAGDDGRSASFVGSSERESGGAGDVDRDETEGYPVLLGCGGEEVSPKKEAPQLQTAAGSAGRTHVTTRAGVAESLTHAPGTAVAESSRHKSATKKSWKRRQERKQRRDAEAKNGRSPGSLVASVPASESALISTGLKPPGMPRLENGNDKVAMVAAAEAAGVGLVPSAAPAPAPSAQPPGEPPGGRKSRGRPEVFVAREPSLPDLDLDYDSPSSQPPKSSSRRPKPSDRRAHPSADDRRRQHNNSSAAAAAAAGRDGYGEYVTARGRAPTSLQRDAGGPSLAARAGTGRGVPSTEQRGPTLSERPRVSAHARTAPAAAPSDAGLDEAATVMTPIASAVVAVPEEGGGRSDGGGGGERGGPVVIATPAQLVQMRWVKVLLAVVIVGLIALAVAMGILFSGGDKGAAAASVEPARQTTTSSPALPPLPIGTAIPTTTTTTTPPVPTSTEPASSARFRALVSLLSREGLGVADVTEKEDPSAPQHRAALWLADVDDAHIPREDGIGDSSPGVLRKVVQRYVLAVLFYSTGGGDGGWVDDFGFLSPGTDECEWNMVKSLSFPTGETISLPNGAFCDENGAVNEVILLDNNLTDSIPSEIGALTDLLTFSVSYNGLVGPLPSELYELKKLGFLWLNSNSLTGSLSSNIGQMPLLTNIWLDENMLSGSLPKEMGQLPLLQYLGLKDNIFSGALPKLTFTHSLVHLDASENMFTGAIPSPLPDQLEVISLHRNEIEGTIPINAGDLPMLWGLSLYDNLLTGTVPQSLLTMSNLEVLDLSNNTLSGSALSGLGGGVFTRAVQMISRLWLLNLAENNLTGSIPKKIGELTAMRQLIINGNMMDGTLPSELGQLLLLEALGLGSNHLKGTLPASVQNLSNLHSLSLELNDLSGDLGFLCESLDLDAFFADCLGGGSEVRCPCCTICCDQHDYCDFQ